jgi:V/A-type H+-transporting ATPase subunit I
MVFGVLFGSVFSMEHLLPALWLHPLDRPLDILVIPLLFGSGLMVLGLLLGALQALWLGDVGSWMVRDAGLLLAFCGLPGLFISSNFALVVVVGAIWFGVGGAWILHHSTHQPLGSAVAASFGTFVERALQLAVNTLSFVRVGAFALAHAGLGLAVSVLTFSSDSWALKAIILVLGNLAIMILEGLVVSIQTTRLVLFEFFVRFFKAEGRPFQPIGLPH